MVQIMACRLFDAESLSEPMPVYCHLASWGQILGKFWLNNTISIQEN